MGHSSAIEDENGYSSRQYSDICNQIDISNVIDEYNSIAESNEKRRGRFINTAHRDVQLAVVALSDLNFSITVRTNRVNKDMIGDIESFSRSLNQQDVGVFYFIGVGSHRDNFSLLHGVDSPFEVSPHSTSYVTVDMVNRKLSERSGVMPTPRGVGQAEANIRHLYERHQGPSLIILDTHTPHVPPSVPLMSGQEADSLILGQGSEPGITYGLDSGNRVESASQGFSSIELPTRIALPLGNSSGSRSKVYTMGQHNGTLDGLLTVELLGQGGLANDSNLRPYSTSGLKSGNTGLNRQNSFVNSVGAQQIQGTGVTIYADNTISTKMRNQIQPPFSPIATPADHAEIALATATHGTLFGSELRDEMAVSDRVLTGDPREVRIPDMKAAAFNATTTPLLSRALSSAAAFNGRSKSPALNAIRLKPLVESNHLVGESMDVTDSADDAFPAASTYAEIANVMNILGSDDEDDYDDAEFEQFTTDFLVKQSVNKSKTSLLRPSNESCAISAFPVTVNRTKGTVSDVERFPSRLTTSEGNTQSRKNKRTVNARTLELSPAAQEFASRKAALAPVFPLGAGVDVSTGEIIFSNQFASDPAPPRLIPQPESLRFSEAKKLISEPSGRAFPSIGAAIDDVFGLRLGLNGESIAAAQSMGTTPDLTDLSRPGTTPDTVFRTGKRFDHEPIAGLLQRVEAQTQSAVVGGGRSMPTLAERRAVLNSRERQIVSEKFLSTIDNVTRDAHVSSLGATLGENPHVFAAAVNVRNPITAHHIDGVIANTGKTLHGVAGGPTSAELNPRPGSVQTRSQFGSRVVCTDPHLLPSENEALGIPAWLSAEDDPHGLAMHAASLQLPSFTSAILSHAISERAAVGNQSSTVSLPQLNSRAGSSALIEKQLASSAQAAMNLKSLSSPKMNSLGVVERNLSSQVNVSVLKGKTSTVDAAKMYFDKYVSIANANVLGTSTSSAQPNASSSSYHSRTGQLAASNMATTGFLPENGLVRPGSRGYETAIDPAYRYLPSADGRRVQSPYVNSQPGQADWSGPPLQLLHDASDRVHSQIPTGSGARLTHGSTLPGGLVNVHPPTPDSYNAGIRPDSRDPRTRLNSRGGPRNTASTGGAFQSSAPTLSSSFRAGLLPVDVEKAVSVIVVTNAPLNAPLVAHKALHLPADGVLKADLVAQVAKAYGGTLPRPLTAIDDNSTESAPLFQKLIFPLMGHNDARVDPVTLKIQMSSAELNRTSSPTSPKYEDTQRGPGSPATAQRQGTNVAAVARTAESIVLDNFGWMLWGSSDPSVRASELASSAEKEADAASKSSQLAHYRNTIVQCLCDLRAPPSDISDEIRGSLHREHPTAGKDASPSRGTSYEGKPRPPMVNKKLVRVLNHLEDSHGSTLSAEIRGFSLRQADSDNKKLLAALVLGKGGLLGELGLVGRATDASVFATSLMEALVTGRHIVSAVKHGSRLAADRTEGSERPRVYLSRDVERSTQSTDGGLTLAGGAANKPRLGYSEAVDRSLLLRKEGAHSELVMGLYHSPLSPVARRGREKRTANLKQVEARNL